MMDPMRLRHACSALLASCAGLVAQDPSLFQPGDRIAFVGNTFAERMPLFANFETMLSVELAELDLTFRSLAWSADTLSLKPRPKDFGTEEEHLHAQRADVIFACYGMNESFAGESGLAEFEADWVDFLERTKNAAYNRDRDKEVVIEVARRFPGMDDGRDETRPVRIVMVSPIAHEDLGRPFPDPTEHNESLAAYTEAMRRIAADHEVAFIDLFTPTKQWMERGHDPSLTFNGIHLTGHGDWVVARMMMRALGFEEAEAPPETDPSLLVDLRDVIRSKNELWFHRWRAVNGFYIYGGRKEPFGVRNFPAEMVELETLIADAEHHVHAISRDQPAPWSALPPTP